jgi:arabinogalactan oligomer/maltooligosaccharide transport system substrate-binding protein
MQKNKIQEEKKMKKFLALLLAATMALGLLVGCGAEKSETVTLKVWAPQEDQANDDCWLPQMLAKFEEAHPEYDITWDLGVCGEGDAGNTVKNDPAAAADVYLFANDQLGTLIQANALSKLGGSYLEQVKADVSATYVNTVTHTDGEVYGFPIAPNTWFMYYNKDVFTEDDVKSLDTMLEKGVVAFPMTTGWYAGSFFMGNGGTLFGEKGVDASAGIQFGGEAGNAAAQYMVDLVANPNFRNDADGLGNNGLKDGSVAAYFSGSWEYEGLKDALGDKLGAVALPTANINGKDVQMMSFAGSKAVGVNPNAKNQKAAMDLAAFLASADSQLVRFELRNITPAATKLAETDAVKASIVAIAENNTMANTAVAQPSSPDMGNYWAPMQTFGEAVVAGSVNSDNIAEQVEAMMGSLNSTGL